LSISVLFDVASADLHAALRTFNRESDTRPMAYETVYIPKV